MWKWIVFPFVLVVVVIAVAGLYICRLVGLGHDDTLSS